MSKSDFKERFVSLYNDGQISLNCDEAEDLLNEVRDTITYDVDTVPDGKMVRVTVGNDEEEGDIYLSRGDIGFFTWMVCQERYDGFFLHFDEELQEWCYIDYDDLVKCEFELITCEVVETDG